MNAPNRFELFILQDGEKPLEIIEDTKIPNAATIKIWKQDHTMANMIRAQLLTNANVLFAGYKVPHPLEPYFILKVQTDGHVTPSAAVQTASQEIMSLLTQLTERFKQEFTRKEMDALGDDSYAPPPVQPAHTGWGAPAGDYTDF
ncbi:RBP11-like subunits of RNA polymerase [Exidia glandulosa HHB12029]|uniref:RBP11-like subunits of RNA polymerase n=1 Tax=Exidia glandulosa HHB12029 TaxID=1314781 RepID=A0A165QLT9_EXIGL|nr:RBP11-like subunits of RNA polymerase [Exidia glandulosa HHB12029]